mmetsp:Transcript_22471/g.32178  ORF Transcript_22471/g.32178 Transcript_22471/m.32178 type:complete len:811 (-) Transcript_22471:2321-4753(-)
MMWTNSAFVFYLFTLCCFRQIKRAQSSWAQHGCRGSVTSTAGTKKIADGYSELCKSRILALGERRQSHIKERITRKMRYFSQLNDYNEQAETPQQGSQGGSDYESYPSLNSSNSRKKRRLLFLDRLALVSEKLLRLDDASINSDGGDDDYDAITTQSDLTLPNRHIHVVTTAALPWMTGTALNPLLRAAYLCKMTKEINSNSTQQYVTLVIPWLELEQDRKELYPSSDVFHSPQDQENFIRNWMRQQDGIREEADPDTGIRILFYPARYHTGLRSIFAMGDICSLVLPEGEEQGDVAILEEAEHLSWYRAPGDGWTKKFKFVIGVMHTNYKEYISGSISGLWSAPGVELISSAMVRAYCHKIIKLSDTLQTYAPEKEVVSNVHGVRQEFITEGSRRGNATLLKTSNTRTNDEESYEDIDLADNGSAAKITNTYFIGKILWAKGLARLIDLEEYYKQCSGQYFSIDVYGNGPEEEEIKRAFFGRNASDISAYSKLGKALSSKIRNSVKRSLALSKKAPTAPQLLTTLIEEGSALMEEGTSLMDERNVNKESWTSRRQKFSLSIKKAIEFDLGTERSKKFAKSIQKAIDFELPKSTYELLRKNPIPATFPGRVDHAILKEQYKIFVNPSVTEVLCTTSLEALAMGKFAILPVHPSNEFFLKFPNCLAYSNKLEFAANLRWALTHEPEPLTPELAYEFTWTAATERFVKAAAITKREAQLRAKFGLSKLDERIAYFINEAGKGAKGDALRKVLGGGPVANQVKYEMEKKGRETSSLLIGTDSKTDVVDDDADFGKFEDSWFASLMRSTFEKGN